MNLIRGIKNLKRQHFGSVVTIGNFDGVHLGHRDLLSRLVEESKKMSVPSTVVIFEPQPSEYFSRTLMSQRLSRLRDKISLIKEHKIDQLLVINFNSYFADLSAEKFISDILLNKLGIKSLIIGEDFKFGKNRLGNNLLLKEYSKKNNFDLIQVPDYLVKNARVSSTAVRELLKNGELERAKNLLGHHYSIEGKVVRGHQRGRKWGFPTANINLLKFKTPLSGIFAVEVSGLSKRLKGVAYVGNRPIIDDPKYVLEVHLFEFDDVCYGQRIKVEFIAQIREDRDFESFDVMATQIKRDCMDAKRILSKRSQ